MRVGDGLIESWSPDGSALIVGKVDDHLSVEGCEGVKEPVFFLLRVADGTSSLAFPNHTDQNGSIVGAQADTDVVMLAGCEGYLGDISVVHQAADGALSDPRTVAIADTAQTAQLTGVSALSLDKSALLLTGKAFDDTAERVVSTRIDLATGAATEIPTGGRGGAHIAEATEGRYVVSDGKAVFVLAADGTVTQTYDGPDFGLSDDGTRIAIVTTDGAIAMADVGEAINETVAMPKAIESAQLTFSPDGSALAVLSYDEDAVVVIVRGGATQVLAEGDSYGRLVWSRTGTSIAFNRFGRDDAAEDVMVAFGSPS